MKQKDFEVLLLPGDGIGKEISEQAVKLIDWITKNTRSNFKIIRGSIGGASIDEYGEPITDETIQNAKKVDAVLLGAVGGEKWDRLNFEIRPERGLLKIRKEMDLFANFRPAIVFNSLVNSSTLKPEVIESLDLLILRELTSGIYFGEPRGIEDISNGSKRGFNTLSYTTEEIERIAIVAFETAKKRSGKLCSVDKANVLESTILWRDVIIKTSKKYPEVKLSHMYVDNAAMQLVRNPKQFDVIVTTNMFGDILSDCASMLTGSLGMLPSASLGEMKNNKRLALYEPVHGSAPDIAGKNIANPIAMFLSVGMMMEYSFELPEMNSLIKTTIDNILKKGFRTKDIADKSNKILGTQEIGNLLISELERVK